MLKDVIYNGKVQVVGIITNGLVHHTPKREVLTQIKQQVKITSRKAGLNNNQANQLWLDAYAAYVDLSKKTYSSLLKERLVASKDPDYSDVLKKRTETVYNSVDTVLIKPGILAKQTNRIAENVEFWKKHDEIREMLDGESIFYLCSAHKNPAKDHEDWEGKVYYDENKINTPELEAFVESLGLLSVQWVTGGPVYMVTRPHCKHFFIPVSLDDVRTYDSKTLVRRMKAYNSEELPLTYEERRLAGLKNKLKAETELKKSVSCEKLEKNIKKDTVLVSRWGNRAKKFKKKKTRSR